MSIDLSTDIPDKVDTVPINFFKSRTGSETNRDGVYTGAVSKLKAHLESHSKKDAQLVQYALPIDKTEVPLNAYLGKLLSLKFEQEIHCIYCNKITKKSFNQGYCYPCSQKLARCDICIVRPEKCHYHLGTCREPDWAQTHCLIPHIVYLANTSGLKVGITRETQIPTRWIDQGATHALPILKVANRAESGLIEVALKTYVNDKTDWRKMLKGENERIDLSAKRDELLTLLKNYDLQNGTSVLDNIETQLNNVDCQFNTPVAIQYPILEYPTKITSLNLEKTPEISGTLLGIKGQYLIFDIGVLNVRNLTGYIVSLSLT